jgi:hypothetical protein
MELTINSTNCGSINSDINQEADYINDKVSELSIKITKVLKQDQINKKNNIFRSNLSRTSLKLLKKISSTFKYS